MVKTAYRLFLRKIEAKATINGGLTGVCSTFYALRKIEAKATIKGGLAGVRSTFLYPYKRRQY